MEGGQSGTYLRLTRASSGPWVSVTKTYSRGAQEWHIVPLLGDVTSPTTTVPYV